MKPKTQPGLPQHSSKSPSSEKGKNHREIHPLKCLQSRSFYTRNALDPPSRKDKKKQRKWVENIRPSLQQTNDTTKHILGNHHAPSYVAKEAPSRAICPSESETGEFTGVHGAFTPKQTSLRLNPAPLSAGAMRRCASQCVPPEGGPHCPTGPHTYPGAYGAPHGV